MILAKSNSLMRTIDGPHLRMPAHWDYTIWQIKCESGVIGQTIMFHSVYSANGMSRWPNNELNLKDWCSDSVN